MARPGSGGRGHSAWWCEGRRAGRRSDIAEVDSGVKHGRCECMSEHVRVCPGGLDTRCRGETAQAAGRRVPVHPRAAAVKQDRSADTRVDGPADRCRQRDQADLGAFAAYAHDPVAVFLAEVGDVAAGGFEDPQPEQAEHGYQREVVPVGRLAGGSEQSLELQVSEPEGR